nr:MAG TPA: portal protein [Caudoviricetes sp.]
MTMAFWNRNRVGPGSRPYMDGGPMVPRWTNPPERNTEEWIRTFRTNPRLAVVERIASDLSFAEGKLFRVDENGDEQEITAHPFLDFWANPNPLHEMSSAALWRLLEIYLKLKGEGYFIMERDEFGRPAELWPVPTHWVQMTPYQGFPYYTVRLTNGQLMEVPVDDMFVMKDLDPYDPFKRGLGQSEALADEIETDEYAAKFQKRFFFNDATPNIIIGMPKSTEEQRKRFLAEWMQRFKGVFQSHGVATVNGDVTVNKIGESMKDMDMVNGRTFLRNAALEHYGVPREIMGITESSNRATSEAAQFIYAQNVLMPILRRREEAINHQLIPWFGDDLVWHFDDIVPRNQEFDKAVGLDGWNAGLLTKDEAREKLGMPPCKVGGDVYKTQFSDVYVHEDDDPAEVSTAAANLQYAEGAPPLETGGQQEIEITDQGEPLDDSSTVEIGDGSDTIELEGVKAADRKASRLQQAQRQLLEAEREQARRFELATMKYFREQNNRLEAALGGTQKADASVWDALFAAMPDYGVVDGAWVRLDEAERERLVSQFVAGLIDWPGEEAALNAIFEPLWKESYDKGAELAAKLHNITAVQRPELVSTAKLRGGSRVRGITQTTKDTIGRIVSNALEHGDSRETIAKQIQQEMQTSASRARTIAAQECNTSLLTGNFDMMKKAGAGTKTWHVTNPAVARPSHKRLNGVTVPIDGKFSNGCRFPCDPDCSDASEVVNCHCFLTYDNY